MNSEVILEKINCILVQSSNKWLKLNKIKNELYETNDISIQFITNNNGTEVNLTSKIPLSRIQIIYNTQIDDAKILGDAWERGYGDLEWRGIVAERVMPWYFFINSKGKIHGVGVKTGAKALCFWQVTPQQIRLTLDIRNGGSDVELSGRLLKVCTIVNSYNESNDNIFNVTREFCQMMCTKPRVPKHQVYGSNNWYYAYGKSSHEDILCDAEFLSEMTKGIPNRPYMVIDDGWQVNHSNTSNAGPWHCGNSKFPNMKKLANEIKAKDIRPGIWFRPLCTTELYPEQCLLDNKRFLNYPDNEYYLDPSHPKVLDKIEEDIKTMIDWGYELIKHDFTTYDILGRWGFQMEGEITNSDWHFFDKSKTTAEIIINLYEVISNAIGKKGIILGCNTISHLAAGLVDIQRTGDDTSGTQWERTRKMGINSLAFRMIHHNTFYSVDADCVGITEKINWENNSQWLDLLSNSGTPLFISVKPSNVNEKQKEIIKEAYKVNAFNDQLAEPIDWLNNTCPCKWKIQDKIKLYNWDEEI